MQVFKQFHKILLDIFNHMLPTIYTVKSLEPVLNCTECTQGEQRCTQGEQRCTQGEQRCTQGEQRCA